MSRAYRHHGTIQELATTLTDRGQREKTWTTFAKAFFGRRSAAAGEVIRGRQVVSEATHRLTMHWLEGVTTKMRLVEGDRIYEFLAVRDAFDNRRELEIDAKELT